MNWGYFTFISLVTIVTGLLSRRGGITAVEAWTLVLTRVGLGVVLGLFLPEQLNPALFVVSGAVEFARLIEHLIAYAADRTGAKLEARKWLNR